MTARSWSGAARALLVAVFAVALVLRVAVPAGWMPERTAGGVRLVPCPAAGPVDLAAPGMAMPAHGGMAMGDAMPPGHATAHGAPHDHHHGDAGETCPFAVAGLAAVAPLAVPVAAPFVVVAPPVSPLSPTVTVGRGLAAPPPPATGPPLLA